MRKYYTLFVIGVILVTGCIDDTPTPLVVNGVKSNLLVTQNDQLAAKIAPRLLNAFQYPEVRAKAKELILEEFDGDYDLLFSYFADQVVEIEKHGVREHVSVRSLLEVESDINKDDVLRGGTFSTSKTMDLIDSVRKFYPLLQLSLPILEHVTPEDWNVEYDALPLAIIPNKIVNDEVPVIHPNGAQSTLSASEYPSSLVLILRNSERVIALPRASNATFNARFESSGDCIGDVFFQDEYSDYVLLDSYHDAQNECTIISLPGSRFPSDTPPNDNPPNDPQCDRDLKDTKDELAGFQFNGVDRIRRVVEGDDDDKSWFSGHLEIHVDIIIGTASGEINTLKKVFHGTRTDFRKCGFLWTNCRTKWFATEVEIVTWDKAIYGDRMRYSFIEYDGGEGTRKEAYSFTTKIGGNDVTIAGEQTFQQNDDHLGSSLVEYCDNADEDGFNYDTGMIRFNVRQRQN